jgi:hypothetical protein
MFSSSPVMTMKRFEPRDSLFSVGLPWQRYQLHLQQNAQASVLHQPFRLERMS